MAISNAVGWAPVFGAAGGGSGSTSSVGMGGLANFGGTGGGVSAGGVETALAGLAPRGFGGATGGEATDSGAGTGAAVAGLTAATGSRGRGVLFHGFQTARAPPRASTAIVAANTASRG